VNRRREPLCGARTDLARLHVIFFDDMLAPVARLVTVGSLQIAASMLEAGCVTPGLMLESPLDALHAWSRDPSLRATARLVDGRRVTIVELQRLFFEDASRFVAQGRCEGVVARAAEIVSHWDAVLGALERRDRDAMATKLDWPLKLTLLEGALSRHSRLTWQSPEIKALDHRYASLGLGGLFLAHQAAGGIERVVGEAEIERAMTEPPDTTRAWTRAMLLRRWGGAVVGIDWDRIDFEVDEGWSRRRFTVALDDPAGAARRQCAGLFVDGACLESVVRGLDTVRRLEWPADWRAATWNRDNSVDRLNRRYLS
jgi:proteasome accessory factor A